MSLRRLLPLLTLLALMLAPFGRIAAAEAMAMPHHSAMMAGHCSEMPARADGKSDKAAVNCLIACATLAPAEAPVVEGVKMAAVVPYRLPTPLFVGRNPAADPPPPRFS